MKQLPNILTLANLFCGALALVFILQSPGFIASYNGEDYMITVPPPICQAVVLIGIAAVFDFFDGLAARLLKVQSPMGRELDSLADVVTFGVAPGMILYQLLRSAYMMQPGAMEVSLVNVAVALLLPCFAAYRLARFNLDERQTQHFIGVPTPAVGLLVASFPLILLYNSAGLAPWLQRVWVLYALIALLCFLMVCNLPFFSLKLKRLSWKENRLRYLFLLLTLLAIPLLKWAAVPFAFALYVALSLGKHFFSPGPE
ncbi:CDP-alcohol phosphatidyltransferase family protein [Compostibacter hankyongensis]|uniref:CDP-alcohol phosphatidyltransferase family protein n=1 Tax=Compostibacter hankyongensis TaxID=1007089 RepID=A0ABP8FFJ0_9BACT